MRQGFLFVGHRQRVIGSVCSEDSQNVAEKTPMIKKNVKRAIRQMGQRSTRKTLNGEKQLKDKTLNGEQ
jgi:hypothetical protein